MAAAPKARGETRHAEPPAELVSRDPQIAGSISLKCGPHCGNEGAAGRPQTSAGPCAEGQSPLEVLTCKDGTRRTAAAFESGPSCMSPRPCGLRLRAQVQLFRCMA
jgi:hypothetical protein